MGMARKLAFAAFIVLFGLWLLVHPERTMRFNSWQDCTTPKGIICISKAR